MAGTLKLEYDENDIRELIKQDIEDKMRVSIKPEDIKILVQSKQNYRVHEWETGKLHVTYEGKQ